MLIQFLNLNPRNYIILSWVFLWVFSTHVPRWQRRRKLWISSFCCFVFLTKIIEEPQWRAPFRNHTRTNPCFSTLHIQASRLPWSFVLGPTFDPMPGWTILSGKSLHHSWLTLCVPKKLPKHTASVTFLKITRFEHYLGRSRAQSRLGSLPKVFGFVARNLSQK